MNRVHFGTGITHHPRFHGFQAGRLDSAAPVTAAQSQQVFQADPFPAVLRETPFDMFVRTARPAEKNVVLYMDDAKETSGELTRVTTAVKENLETAKRQILDHVVSLLKFRETRQQVPQVQVENPFLKGL